MPKSIEGEEFIDFIMKYRYSGAVDKILDLDSGNGVAYTKDFKEQLKKRYKKILLM